MKKQIVNIKQDKAYCVKCDNSLLEIRHFKYSGVTNQYPERNDEMCKCTNCGTPFVLRYNLFDLKGHIDPRTFSGDINDPEYNWTDALSDDQKKGITSHLKACKHCQEALNDEVLKDSWFADIIHQASRGYKNPKD